jgi:hypothetical protein
VVAGAAAGKGSPPYSATRDGGSPGAGSAFSGSSSLGGRSRGNTGGGSPQLAAAAADARASPGGPPPEGGAAHAAERSASPTIASIAAGAVANLLLGVPAEDLFPPSGRSSPFTAALTAAATAPSEGGAASA